jgi:hypothetical protein
MIVQGMVMKAREWVGQRDGKRAVELSVFDDTAELVRVQVKPSNGQVYQPGVKVRARIRSVVVNQPRGSTAAGFPVLLAEGDVELLAE